MVDKKKNEYEQLRRMIIDGEIFPNERIIETHYANLFDINRANIRRALSRLEQEGLIISEPFRGARVRQISKEEGIEIFEVRGVLEVLIARHAAVLAMDSDKEILRNYFTKIEAEFQEGNAINFGRETRKFREELWRISKHTTATKVVSSLNTQLVRIWHHSLQTPGRMRQALIELRDILVAIEGSAADDAEKAMRRYNDSAIKALRSTYKVGDSGM